MTKRKTISQVKQFWNEQAIKYKVNPLATTHDKFLRDLEMSNILKYIPLKRRKVIDIGCGNGYSTVEFARQRQADFTGVDYSEEMIKQANQLLNKNKRWLKGKLSFQVGDILDLPFKDEEYDIASTDRCLINLISLKDQKKAIAEIHRILKKNGKYIMCEDTQAGLKKLNNLRRIANLNNIPNHWHNLYLNEKKIVPFIKKYFRILKIDNFASTYYIASRIFNAISSSDTKKPDYFSPINEVAKRLPALGDYSPIKIFYLEKK